MKFLPLKEGTSKCQYTSPFRMYLKKITGADLGADIGADKVAD